jgi:hypothetical protein
MKGAWVRIASGVRTPAADRLKNNGAHCHARTPEAMRTQAFSKGILEK